MTLKLDRKVPGGKLLRVEIEAEAGRVSRVLVRGDFFAHPEELFEEAEAGLAGLGLAELPGRARLAFARPGLTLHGASPDAIAETLAAAIAADPAAGSLPAAGATPGSGRG